MRANARIFAEADEYMRPQDLHGKVIVYKHKMENKAVSDYLPDSTITCPSCGESRTETMPTDYCQWYYDCTHCGVLLKPLQGDCCVFCSYGSVKCPPIQAGTSQCCKTN